MNDIDDKQIDDLLRSHFIGDLSDDGFSARVTRLLPPRRRPRTWLPPVAALAGSLLAWATLLPSPILKQTVHELQAGSFGATSVGVFVLLFVISLLGCGWALDES